jgi:long-chain acyl-CoA synthetase
MVNKNKTSILTYVIVYPLLFIIGIIDYIISLFVPLNRDKSLPHKDTILSKNDKNDPSSPYRSTLFKELIAETDPNANLYDEFNKSAQKYAELRTLGVRQLLSIEEQMQENGKTLKKHTLGWYEWSNYKELNANVCAISNGLLKCGIKSDDNLIIFSETKPEWITSAFACFKIKVIVVTLYATLGLDALQFGINQTNSSFVVTTGEQLNKIEKILDKIPKVTHLIVITDKFTEDNFKKFRTKTMSRLTVYSFRELIDIGKQTAPITNYTKPCAADLAIIMYTSGSTGQPKGVMISHGNILTAIKGFSYRLGEYSLRDTYIAYLPLAHILELCFETLCLLKGIQIGYSSPFTLTDVSTAIREGDKGDLAVLKPSLIACVPIVLERFCKGVNDKIDKAGPLKSSLFKRAYDQKLKSFDANRSTVLLNKIVFNKVSTALLGGRIRVIVCGGALLNKDVQKFAQVCLGSVIQAYG